VCTSLASGRYRGVAMVSAVTPSEICVRSIQLTSECVGGIFLVTVQEKGFRRLLSADEQMFRLIKATKIAW